MAKPTWPKGAWTPVRRGKLYCSPACGGGCTWAAYQKAKSEAELVASLLGPNWKASVRENLHWFWYVGLDTGEGLVLTIIPFEHDGRVTYSAMLGTSLGSGEYGFSTNKHFKNPRNAVRNQMRLFRAYVHKRDAQLAALESGIKRR